ncbi:MAG: hypothetical protein DIU78_009245 [Pseudomonadota bacterium]
MTIKRVGWATTLALLGAIGACTVTVEDGDKDGSGGSAGSGGSDASGGKTSSGGATGDAGAESPGDAGETGTGGSGAGGDTSSAGAAGDDGAAGSPSGTENSALPESFTPSTLPSDFDLEVTEDLILNGEMCGSRAEIDTDDGEIRCYTSGLTSTKTYYAFAVVKQEDDGSEVAVFAGRNIEIDTTIQVKVVGQRPLVLLAPGDVTVRGHLEAVPNGDVGHGGGFSSPNDSGAKGLGPGGGGGGFDTAAGGGGGYCGPGGKGGGEEGAAGGKTYGNPEIVPLIGGSSGGKGSLTDAGPGGGAIQIVAGGELYVTSTATIHVGGGGGTWGSSGGGSGGAILLEGETVRVAGTLAANGGGGGGQGTTGDNGQNARPDAEPAKGGTTKVENGLGGDGAAGEVVAGSDGGSTGGGGGGGAGRIRINSRSGEASITGTLSPSLDTECATQGTLGD